MDAITSLPPCAECGFDSATLPLTEISQRLAALTDQFGDRLTSRAPERLRAPGPIPGWTALEYAGHIADVLELFSRRVAHLLAADEPVLEVVDHDALVSQSRHNDAGPLEASARIRSGATALVAVLSTVDGRRWERAGTRAGDRRTVRETAFRAVHEMTHHLMDVDRLLDQVRRPASG